MKRWVGAVAVAPCLVLLAAGCPGQSSSGDHDLGSGGDLSKSSLDLRSTDMPPAVVPAGHPRIYLNDANRTRLNGAIAANNKAATDFADMVDQQLAYGDCNTCDPANDCEIYEFRPWHAAMMYALTGDAKYSAFAIKMVDDCVKREEDTIASGQRADISFDSYLYIGDILSDVMLTYDWCFDKVSDSQKQRWIAYANQAVWNVWHPDEAKWGATTFAWSGWSIDNPSNNYYYSFLKATMLTGLATKDENAQADDWLTMFRTTKIQNQLVPTFTSDLVGGGSREGTGYGVSMAGLFYLYDLWQQSTGEPLHGLTPHAEQSLLWMQHAIVPTLDRLAPIGDHARDSTAALFDYHRNYLQILGFLFDGTVPAQTSRTLLSQSSVPEMSQRFMYIYDFFYDSTGKPTSPLTSLYPVYYGSGTGQVFARSAWTKDATWLGFSAGPFTESHAHHDQGQLLVYRNEWLLYDGNIASHSGIQSGEEGHNVLRVGSGSSTIRMVDQTTSTLQALQDESAVLHLAGDLLPAYGTSNLDRNQREIVWIKPNVIVVFDRIKVAGTVAQQWNSPIDPSLTANVATLAGKTSKVALHLLAPASTNWSEQPLSAFDVDFESGFHVEASAAADAGIVFLTVINVDDAASSITRSDDAGWIGASFNLTAGGSAIVRFDPAAPGASVELKNASNQIVVDKTYDASIQTLPTLQ